MFWVGVRARVRVMVSIMLRVVRLGSHYWVYDQDAAHAHACGSGCM